MFFSRPLIVFERKLPIFESLIRIELASSASLRFLQRLNSVCQYRPVRDYQHFLKWKGATSIKS